MWDLTVPGDHYFYVTVAAIAVLVHNCSSGEIPYNSDELSNAAYHARAENGTVFERNVAVAKQPGWNDPVLVITLSRWTAVHGVPRQNRTFMVTVSEMGGQSRR
jgi:hypothetical protein